MGSALLIIDMQKDFMPKGSLAIEGADRIIPCINQLIDRFPLVIASKDFHPPRHVSFASSHHGKDLFDEIDVEGSKQILWPEHCVIGTEGCNLHSEIDAEKIDFFIHKGVDQQIDSYSAFFDNAHARATGLDHFLKDHSVSRVFICGVATEYCVLFSTLDALELGLEVFVIVDACKGVDRHQGDEKKAFELMKNKGALLLFAKDVDLYI